MRLYFLHGGKRVWFSIWLETGAWPVIIFPIACVYVHRRKTQPGAKLFLMKLPLFIASAGLVATGDGEDDGGDTMVAGDGGVAFDVFDGDRLEGR
ncbi:hypothetical protein COLO4_32351 [Corchorus olitorius]|uniref:Uncharacterized protein n=1 Tax=Corchorus olitorius TaxID=93759 RepID=A0A1R3GZP6_9ROSI|nr:hypothetical protein COLO4_32351 [Corchorus olitorius]